MLVLPVIENWKLQFLIVANGKTSIPNFINSYWAIFSFEMYAVRHHMWCGKVQFG
jgi:hypothetical protein